MFTFITVPEPRILGGGQFRKQFLFSLYSNFHFISFHRISFSVVGGLDRSFLSLLVLFSCDPLNGILLNPFVSRNSLTLSRKLPSVPSQIMCAILGMIFGNKVNSSSVCLGGSVGGGLYVIVCVLSVCI